MNTTGYLELSSKVAADLKTRQGLKPYVLICAFEIF